MDNVKNTIFGITLFGGGCIALYFFANNIYWAVYLWSAILVALTMIFSHIGKENEKRKQKEVNRKILENQLSELGKSPHLRYVNQENIYRYSRDGQKAHQTNIGVFTALLVVAPIIPFIYLIATKYYIFAIILAVSVYLLFNIIDKKSKLYEQERVNFYTGLGLNPEHKLNKYTPLKFPTTEGMASYNRELQTRAEFYERQGYSHSESLKNAKDDMN